MSSYADRGAVGLLAAALLAVAAVHADEPAIRSMVSARIPDATIVSVRELGRAGLFEVTLQRPQGYAVVYADETARTLFVGSVIDARTERNLTEERVRTLTRIEWGSLPFDRAITMKRGDGRRKIAIFSDPNCPFCRRLEGELAKVNDITVHIFMYPVIKPDSVRLTKAVWCSRDRVKAWNDLMLKGVEPVSKPDCPNPVDELVALGHRLGATATPTWFLESGEKYSGALKMSDLVPLLDAASSTRRLP
jgi:thiol:disulfide interchange protein DsbC